MGNSGGHEDRNLKDSSELALLGKIMMFGILGLFFIIIVFLFLHLYNRLYWFSRSEDSNAVTFRRRRRAPRDFAPTQHQASANRVGLDPSTLKAIPIFTYNPKDFKDGIECVVCLSELAAGDKIRLLKTCNHGFHVDCIDMWLQSHSTCPVCRNPLSTISNPTSEVEQILEIEESPEIQELPTNVLFWGDETEVRNSSLSNQENGNRAVAIDAVAASSSGVNGETKPSVIMSRLRSLKRLLSGERVNPSCSSSSNEAGEEHV